MSGPAFLYLHGFASSPLSSKAQAFVAWGKARGIDVVPLDLRVPTFEGLLFSAIVAKVREAIDAAGGSQARVALIGSSLGGLTACRVAEQDPRVCAVFAMAPAFRLVDRWKATLGDSEWEKWRREGFREVDDHLTKAKAKVHFAFVDELERIDAGDPDVRVPVRIVHGTKDEIVDVQRSRDFAAEKRHVRLVRGRRRARARRVDPTYPLGSRSLLRKLRNRSRRPLTQCSDASDSTLVTRRVTEDTNMSKKAEKSEKTEQATVIQAEVVTEKTHDSIVDKVFDAAFAKAAQALVAAKNGLEASARWLEGRAKFVGDLAKKLETEQAKA